MSLNRKQRIEQSFGKRVHSYHEKAHLQRDVAKTLAQILPESNPSKILEIGCGTGFLTEELLRKYPNAHIHATDLSADMVDFTRQRFTGYKNLSCQVQDGENLNLSDTYDLIVSSMTVQWFNDPVATLASYKDYLTPNGKVYFSTLGQESFKEWHQSCQEAKIADGFLNTPHYEGIIKEETTQLNYQSGLDFLKHLKEIGTHQPHPSYIPHPPHTLKTACDALEKNHATSMTYHIIYGQI